MHAAVAADDRLRVIIETDAGGDPDDEQSLVRFLLYCNEWDVEAIIANRAEASTGRESQPAPHRLRHRPRDDRCVRPVPPQARQHDPRYPTPQFLLDRTVPGYAHRPAKRRRVVAAVDDPQSGAAADVVLQLGHRQRSAPSSLKLALDLVRASRGRKATKFKNRLRLSSDDQFGNHTHKIHPLFKLWVDTFRPELDRRRWYHRFSAITAKAGGFDVDRDVRTNHGPLGALYPTNTTHPQKEGDSMTSSTSCRRDSQRPNRWGAGPAGGRAG